ncbi:MAG: hypothetical protein WDW36_006288 [Sanguina aurantia]
MTWEESVTYGVLCVFLVCTAGMMSGLTLGLMSLDMVDMEVLKRSGTPKEQQYAAAIMPVISNSHFLLVTLLLCNAAAMEALPIFLERLASPVVAILLSVTAVLFFGEIIPQAVCSKYGLAIGASLAWLVRIIMALCSPIAWPLGKLLDVLLGTEQHVLFRRKQLKALVDLHGEGGGMGGKLSEDEIKIITGALDLTSKVAYRSMTPPGQGHSRIPVFREGNRSDIVGLILVKELLQYKMSSDVPVELLKMRSLPRLPATTPMYDMLKLFQTGRSHIAVLTQPDPSVLEYALSYDPGASKDRRSAAARPSSTRPVSAFVDDFDSSDEEEDGSEAGARDDNGDNLGGLDSEASSLRGGSFSHCDFHNHMSIGSPIPGLGSSLMGGGWRGAGKARPTPPVPAATEQQQPTPQTDSWDIHTNGEGDQGSHGRVLQRKRGTSSVPDPRYPGSSNGSSRLEDSTHGSGHAQASNGGHRPSSLGFAAAFPHTAAALASVTSITATSSDFEEGCSAGRDGVLHDGEDEKRPLLSGGAGESNSVQSGGGDGHGKEGGGGRQRNGSRLRKRAVAIASVAVGQPIGIITIEDVIEELIRCEIVDETDRFVDNERLIKVNQALLAQQLPQNLIRVLTGRTSSMAGIVRAARNSPHQLPASSSLGALQQLSSRRPSLMLEEP